MKAVVVLLVGNEHKGRLVTPVLDPQYSNIQNLVVEEPSLAYWTPPRTICLLCQIDPMGLSLFAVLLHSSYQTARGGRARHLSDQPDLEYRVPFVRGDRYTRR